MLKIKPFEKYVGDDEVIMYVGIRADEDRTAYVSTKPNIKTVLPFPAGIHDRGRAPDSGGERHWTAGLLRLADPLGLLLLLLFRRRIEWVGLSSGTPTCSKRAKPTRKSTRKPESGIPGSGKRIAGRAFPS